MFDTHKLNDAGFAEMQRFKQNMANAVKNVTQDMPDSREKSIFLTKIEEAVFFGAKAIASNPAYHYEVTTY
jgi:hypothetical protein